MKESIITLPQKESMYTVMLYENPERCVRIPMRSDLRSLNLSNSAAIAVYEVLRQWDFPDLSREGQLTKYRWQKEG